MAYRQTNPKFWAETFKKAQKRLSRGLPAFTSALRRDSEKWNRCAVNEARFYHPAIVKVRGETLFPRDHELMQLGSLEFPAAIRNNNLEGAKLVYRLILDRVHDLYCQSLGV